jgi:hypothetical protein
MPLVGFNYCVSSTGSGLAGYSDDQKDGSEIISEVPGDALNFQATCPSYGGRKRNEMGDVCKFSVSFHHACNKVLLKIATNS